MNKVRIEFLKDRLKLIKRNQNDDISLQDLKDIDGPFPLKGLRVLDVGCGGGLFSEVKRLQMTFIMEVTMLIV